MNTVLISGCSSGYGLETAARRLYAGERIASGDGVPKVRAKFNTSQ
jgi:NAD(P)-dependent dehydrogenase (short-subunit alcohol dehydrogenase family)